MNETIMEKLYREAASLEPRHSPWGSIDGIVESCLLVSLAAYLLRRIFSKTAKITLFRWLPIREAKLFGSFSKKVPN